MLERLIFASIQGGIALAGVWLICLVGRRLPASVKVWLWRLAMLKMLVALIFPAPTLAVLPTAKSSTPALVAKDAPSPEPENLNEEFTITTSDSTTLTTEIRQTQPANVELANPGMSSATALAAPVKLANTPSPWLLAWTLGGITLALLAGIGLLRARRAIRNTRLVEDSPAIDTANSAANQARLRKAPALRAFEHTGSPFVTGLLRPFVAVPQSLIRNLDELRLTLLHEFAHLKRGDLPWAFFMTATRALFWFHPLAWIAEREHRVQSEIACDAFVVQSSGNRRGYALALVRLAILGAGDTRAAATLGAVGSRRALHRRLSEMSKPLSRRLNFRDALAIVLPVAILLIPIHLAARAPQSPNNDPAVPLVVPAISPSELDDSTLPELEQMGAKDTATTKATKLDLNLQLVALKNLQEKSQQHLTPEQKAKVQAELKKAIEELTRALNEELPKAMAEAQKELAQAKGDDAKTLTPQMRKQIEDSIRTATESVRKALKELTLEKMHLDKDGMIVAPGQSIDISPEFANPIDDKTREKLLRLKMTKDKDGNVKVQQLDDKALKELMKMDEMGLEQLKNLPLIIQGMNLDDLKGMKFKTMDLDKLKGMEMKFKEMKAEDMEKLMKEKGLKFEHLDGQPLLIKQLQGEKLHELAKMQLSQAKEWKLAHDQARAVIVQDQPNLKWKIVGDKANTVIVPDQPNLKWKVVGDKATSVIVPDQPNIKWRTEVTPNLRFMTTKGYELAVPSRNGADPFIQRYFVQGKPLTAAQKKKLKEIDKKIQELMKQRQKLSPGGSLFAPTTVTLPAFSGDFFRAAPAAPTRTIHTGDPVLARPATAPPASLPAAPAAKPGNAPPPPSEDEL